MKKIVAILWHNSANRMRALREEIEKSLMSAFSPQVAWAMETRILTTYMLPSMKQICFC